MKIRTTLYLILAVNFIVLLGLVGALVLNINVKKARTAYLVHANTLADSLLGAAAEQAKDRGFNNGLLNSEVDNPGLVTKIETVRTAGDAHMATALDLLDKMVQANQGDNSPHAASLATAQRDLLSSWKALGDARPRMQASWGPKSNSIESDEWLRVCGTNIDTLRGAWVAAVYPSDRLEEISFANSRIKDMVWLVSEHAGQERANMASVVDTTEPIPQAKFEKLMGLRAIVDSSVSQVQLMSSVKDQDPRIVSAIKEMESKFLGNFESLRQQIYAESSSAKASGAPANYPVDTAGWLSAATEGINSVLAVTDAISVVMAEHGAAEVAAQNKNFAGAMVAVVIALAVTLLMFFTFEKRVIGPIAASSAHFVEISETNDLTIRVKEKGNDEMAIMGKAFNSLVSTFQEIIGKISEAAQTLSSSAEELAAGADETSKSVQQVARTIEEVSSGSKETMDQTNQARENLNENAKAIEGIAKDIEEVAAYANEASAQGIEGQKSANEAAEIINNAADSVRETSAVVKALGEKTEQISEFIGIITAIADQTNLLALNAAIEAARAGDAGRGFAVVAEEVRKLAEESNGAAGNITTLVKSIGNEMDTALAAMKRSDEQVSAGAGTVQQASQVLGEIVTGVESLNEKVQNISASAEQINASTTEVVTVMGSVAQAAEKSASSAEEVAAATEEQTAAMEEINANTGNLSGLAQELQNLVSQFKV